LAQWPQASIGVQKNMSHIPFNLQFNLQLYKDRQLDITTWDASSGLRNPIPIALRPIVVADSQVHRLRQSCKAIAAAFPRLLGWLQLPSQQTLFKIIFDGLSPFESLMARLPAASTGPHATWRFDLYWPSQKTVAPRPFQIIEANCTIPAMQAYSDLVTKAWCDAQNLSHSILPSNSKDLLSNLEHLFQSLGSKQNLETIGILHRPNDSQIAELNHYQKQWSQHYQVLLAPSDQVRVQGDSLYMQDTKLDLVYRHIFAHRLQDQPSLLHALLHNRTFRIFNPVSAHYEAKAFLALLKTVIDQDLDIGLEDSMRNAVHFDVPWTRVIHSKLPAALRSEWSLLEQRFLAAPEALVWKQSVGYGGHQVLMTDDWSAQETQSQIQQMTKLPSPISPKQFWDWLTQKSPSTWIVQERLQGRRHQTDWINRQGNLETINGFVDASIFLCTGPEIKAEGLVSRIAKTPIVNIGTGGGLLPVFTESQYNSLKRTESHV
jgi:hypothetical protein